MDDWVVRISIMESDIKYIKKSIDKIESHIDTMHKEYNNRFKALDRYYASKYVERAFWSIIGAGLSALVSLVIFVFQNPIGV